MSEISISQDTLSNIELRQFIANKEEDILIYHPDFELETAELSNFIVLRSDNQIIGVFIYQEKGDQMHVDVDYIVEEHRDKGVGLFFYGSKIDDFRKLGFTSVYAIASHPKYQNYLSEIGFKPVSNQSELFSYDLP